MKRPIMMAGAALMMVAGSAVAGPQAQLDQCESYCDSAHPAYSTAHQSCIADCFEDYHEATGQGASVDPGWIEHDTQSVEDSTMMATSDYHQCQIDCSSENPSEDAYNSCISGCAADNQASTEPPTMIAQPTGNGGFFGGGGQNQQAYYGTCTSRCNLHTTESGYKACMNGCNAQNQASNKPLTMVADIRIGDPQPICGTDPWACFNGTDDSPDIRNVDVGIFGVFADSR